MKVMIYFKKKSFAFLYRFFCVVIVACFDLYLWLNDTVIYPVFYILNLMQCDDLYAPANIIDITIAITALLLQLSLRLYLRFVKKIQSSNEIMSFKFNFFLLLSYGFLLLPPPESSRSIVIFSIIPFDIMITTILFDHSGMNQFFMERHPNFRDTTAAIWHLMVQFYIKVKEWIILTCNTLQELFLNLIRSNQIQPYDVPE